MVNIKGGLASRERILLSDPSSRAAGGRKKHSSCGAADRREGSEQFVLPRTRRGEKTESSPFLSKERPEGKEETRPPL